ncbi:MAG: aminomethyl-transferring glycine dehydrogenase subunit GcvPA [bacterium]
MYIPHKSQDIQKIKDFLGIESVDEIFYEITGKNEFFEPVNLGEPLSQQEIIEYFRSKAPRDYVYFLGAGAYDHFIPPIVDALLRSEFVTSYTPYQAEVSQGTLKIIWDFQSLICEIFGQEVSNSSHYDGATATAEAILMAKRIYQKIDPKANKIIVSNSLHPSYIEVIKTYTEVWNIEKVFVDFDKQGKVDLEALEKKLSEDVFAVVIQNPNFWGVIEDKVDEIKKIIGEKFLILVVMNPFVYFLFDPPKVDIVAANLQPFGIPLSFGGPYLGVIASSMKYIREMPGRIIGKTVDKEGKEAYTMILQTREQHIRREKATSNICTNQGLMAIRNTIYLMAMGKTNLIKVAQKNYTNIRFFAEQFSHIGKMLFNDVFNESLFHIPNYEKIYNLFKSKGVILGISLDKLNINPYQLENLKKIGIGNNLQELVLICTTEKISKKYIRTICQSVQNYDFSKSYFH